MYYQGLTLVQNPDWTDKLFLNLLRLMRGNLVKDRFKIYQQIEGKRKKTFSFSFPKLVIGIYTAFSGYRAMVDFYLDIYITKIIYDANQDPKAAAANHYLVALMVCFTSLASTFMIAQSGIVALKFISREYEDYKAKKLNCFRRVANASLLSFLGALLTIPLEIIENLTKLFSPFDALLSPWLEG